MKWSILSVAINGLLLGLLSDAKVGVILTIDASLVNQFGGIILLVVLLITNTVTIWSLNEAGSCIFGYLLSSKSGYTFAVCGYMHSSTVGKMLFSQSLSLTSKYRKVLTRAAFLWVLLELVKILTPFIAISVVGQRYAIFNTFTDCIYFTQDDKLRPFDRKWPTLDSASGVAEYVFGSSLGIMRSEVTANLTTAMYPPSLISVVNNGDVIEGLGFTADILTTCMCPNNLTTQALINAGVDASQVGEIMQEYLALERMPGITFGVVTHNDSLVISNVFSGYNLCGGNSRKLNQPLVCSTVMNNHQVASLEITFMTDGTTASISPANVNLLNPVSKANVDTWLSFAMNSITNGPVSSYMTPATVPGSLAPLLWWTSPNLIAMDRASVEAGIETMYAILFKAAIQRTYTAEGASCPRKNVIASFQSLVSILPSGYGISVIFLVIQMSISVLSILSFSLWLTSSSPLGPAVRATQEPIYLITLLASSNNVGLGLNDLCNAETYSIWQKLDTKCRIGESAMTLDSDIGKIVVDKPSLVRPLTNGRRYS
ncbi:hypothetical protein HDU98_005004 [Podochytrium sp. JEL0797]|nr:hypothetical protein HDU98_005004 [Podochytrium sp. JEL0797]